MKLIHSKYMYKESIFKALINFPIHYKQSAMEGAIYLFDELQRDLPDKVYALFLNELKNSFFHHYQFDDGESFTNGFLLARYYILRRFKLSYEEFYDYLKSEKKNNTSLPVNSSRVTA